MRNGNTCGVQHCDDVELYISGTAYLVEHTYALADPKPRANRDPNCSPTGQPRMGQDASEPRGRNRRSAPPSMPQNDTQVAAMSANYGRHHDTTGPSTLPAQVWTGWSYVYSGYMQVVDKKNKRKAGDGYFELVWPADGRAVFTAPNWAQVASNTLPADALFVRRPYRVTLQFWDDKREEREGRDRSYYRD